MIRFTLFLSLFLSLVGINEIFAQVSDDFSDGDFLNNPTWQGDTFEYEVDTLWLHLNDTAAGQSHLFTTSQSIENASWEFTVLMGFNPSSSNYASVYLVSDQPNISGNGYFVKIGNTSDDVSLYRQNSGSGSMIIDGGDGRLNSGAPVVRVKVSRDNLGNWELYSDTTGGTNYVLEGTANDNTYTSSGYFGVSSTYTSTRKDKFWFDDIAVTGSIMADTVAPYVDSVVVISNTSLDIYFSELTDVVSAETTTNYQVDGGIGIPGSALVDAADSSLVHLSFPFAFTATTLYNVSISNVEDRNSNVMTTSSHPFMYFIPDTVLPGDVIINEFLADPSPQVALPAVEFIEIYNVSNKTFDVSSWKIGDASGNSGGFPQNILVPGGYLIICPVADEASYSVYGNTAGVSSFPSLNNSGDDIVLQDLNGVVIDMISYTDDWYNDNTKDDGGWSIERINSLLPCSFEDNWKASEDPAGGSPGTINSVNSSATDSVSPYLSSVVVLSQTEIEVFFNEPMDSNTLGSVNYLFNNGISSSGIQVMAPAYTSVRITLSPLLDSSLIYTLRAYGFSDCSGNTTSGDTIQFAIGVTADKFDILMVEFYPDPDASVSSIPEFEFVELYNRSSKPINLNGFVLSDASTSTTLSNYLMFPGDYVIICDNDDEDAFEPYGSVLIVGSLPSLNNAGDQFTLKKDSVNIIHEVNYTDDWYNDTDKDGGGWTLEMIDPDNPCGEIDNWAASVDSDGGTPGKQNSVYANNPDLLSPEISTVNIIEPDLLLVVFDEIITSNNIENLEITLDNGTTIDTFLIAGSYYLQIYLDSDLQSGKIYTLSVVDLFDCVGNGSDASFLFAMPEPGISGDILINEILFDPRGSGTDFVELYNHSSKNISLKDWYLATTKNDTIDSEKLISTEDKIMFPGEFVVINKDNGNVMDEYPLAIETTLHQISSLPTYSNGNGTVVLINNNLQVVDSVSYHEDWHFGLLNSVDGVSLERINYNMPSYERTNWHSASEDVGFATPGYKNSQSKEDSDGESEVTVVPEVFSPDNDGFEDVTSIIYNFSEAGFVGSITIFDSYGRLVRTLKQNILLSQKGSFNWDGTNNGNEKAPIGIYIVYFEVFNLSGDIKGYKIPVVVAAKF